MNTIPKRIFQAHTRKNSTSPIFPGKEEWSQERNCYIRIGAKTLKIDKFGRVTTDDPSVINAVLTKFRFDFLKPKFEINESGLNNKFVGYHEEVNEVYDKIDFFKSKEEHKKAVEKAIKEGAYDFIPEEDVELEFKNAQKEKMKLDLIELKRENEKRKKKILEGKGK